MNFPPPKECSIQILPQKDITIYDQVFFETGNDGIHQWESGIVLARFLVNFQISGQILELGSGTGLAGIACAKYNNPQRVVLTDYNQQVLSGILKNLENNEINSEVCYLDWKERASYLGKKFDCIIGSDLIYEGAPIEELVRCIYEHLKQSGKCYIVMPDKRKMTPCFINEISRAGMTVETQSLTDDLYISSPYEDVEQGYKDFRELTMHKYMLYTIFHSV